MWAWLWGGLKPLSTAILSCGCGFSQKILHVGIHRKAKEPSPSFLCLDDEMKRDRGKSRADFSFIPFLEISAKLSKLINTDQLLLLFFVLVRKTSSRREGGGQWTVFRGFSSRMSKWLQLVWATTCLLLLMLASGSLAQYWYKTLKLTQHVNNWAEYASFPYNLETAPPPFPNETIGAGRFVEESTSERYVLKHTYLGRTFSKRILRFPGGSSPNSVSHSYVMSKPSP